MQIKMCVKYNNIHEYINTVNNNNCSTKVIHIIAIEAKNKKDFKRQLQAHNSYVIEYVLPVGPRLEYMKCCWEYQSNCIQTCGTWNLYGTIKYKSCSRQIMFIYQMTCLIHKLWSTGNLIFISAGAEICLP